MTPPRMRGGVFVSACTDSGVGSTTGAGSSQVMHSSTRRGSISFIVPDARSTAHTTAYRREKGACRLVPGRERCGASPRRCGDAEPPLRIEREQVKRLRETFDVPQVDQDAAVANERGRVSGAIADHR